jgi:biotin transport system substrate-specific component
MKATLLSEKLWPVSGNHIARSTVLAVAGSLLVAVAAQISVPMHLVPITLQSLAVLLIGTAYGARLGAVTLALYALAGAVGLPVFSGLNSGFQNPSFGYVLGFIPAAYLVGFLAERGWDRSPPRMFLTALLGAVLVYVPGLIWLSAWVGSAAKTIEVGLLPFIVNDLIEIAVAAVALPTAWALIGRR